MVKIHDVKQFIFLNIKSIKIGLIKIIDFIIKINHLNILFINYIFIKFIYLLFNNNL